MNQKGCRNIFFMPDTERKGMPHGELCGDFMPFYWQGIYYFFYLYKYCIYVTETRDFVNYTDPYLAIQNGSPDEQDWHIGTGSVFYKDEIFYFYYTGFNEFCDGVSGEHVQGIMRAFSRDLKVWEKDREFCLYPNEDYYESLHWRDPQIIWNKEIGRYCMLITATDKQGAYFRNGCTAVMVSDDLLNWDHYDTIYTPGTYITHECQDLFEIDGMCYLIFSNYTRWWETRYRIANKIEGPWQTPYKDDMFDGRELYAAKTVTDGERRYLVGWQSVRKDCLDANPHIWGGNVLVHELICRTDHTLGVVMPHQIEESFCNRCKLCPIPVQGKWENKDGQIFCESPFRFSYMEMGKMKDTCMLRAELEWSEDTRTIGLMLRVSDKKLTRWVQLRLEISHSRIVADRFNKIDGDQNYLEERYVDFKDGKAIVKVIASGSIVVCYVNDTALSFRCYEYGTAPGTAGIFVENGSIFCCNFELLVQKE